MPFSGSCGRVLRGVTFLKSLAPGKRRTTTSTNGTRTEHLTQFAGDYSLDSWTMENLTPSFGASTGRLCEPPDVPPVVEKKSDPQEPEDHALGRSRGGFSTKIHLICDADGLPLHFEITPGQAHENTSLIDLLDGTDAEVTDSSGNSVAWPLAIAGDKGYRANWIDEMLTDMEITPVIPSKSNEDHDARRVNFDKERYRQRNIVERLIGWLKECRRVFSRFEKTAINFRGMIKMAIIQRYLKIATSRL